MRVTLPDWLALGLFAAAVLALAAYALAVSAHFPREHRRDSLRGIAGTLILWGTVTVAAISAGVAIHTAVTGLPAHAAILAGGVAVLAAPLILKPLPDGLIDEGTGLLLFAGLAAGLAFALTRL